jgi:hypothetical protein
MRYLGGTISVSLLLSKSDSILVSEFSDAEWEGCLDDMSSSGGYCYIPRIQLNFLVWKEARYCISFKHRR